MAHCINHSLKPGPARQADPGLEPGRVEEKTGKEKTQFDPTNPVKNLVVTH